jgi:transcriptional repressor NrdR
MFCINCFHPTTRVANSRPHKKRPSVWRRRTCPKCQTTFTTYERPSLAENRMITLPSGEAGLFNLGRLVISIASAFTHQPDDAKYHSLWLAQTVEDILSTEYPTITPDDIAAVTHQTLKQFDELAAIQYGARHGLIASTRKRGRPSLSERARRSDESPSR